MVNDRTTSSVNVRTERNLVELTDRRPLRVAIGDAN